MMKNIFKSKVFTSATDPTKKIITKKNGIVGFSKIPLLF